MTRYYDDTYDNTYDDTGVLTISLSALQDNYRHMKKCSGAAEAAAVVKADAYGIGLAAVAPALAAAGCTSFFVAQAHEAFALRDLLSRADSEIDSEADIYVLNGLPRGAAPDFAASRLRPCLISLDQIRAWQSHCLAEGSQPACLFVDTGFNRLGLSALDIADLAEDHALFEGWKLSLIASHLACAEDTTHPMNRAQLERFRLVLKQLPDAPASLANSGGTLMGAAYHLDMTRIGISLYGGAPSGQPADALSPVASLQAPILQIRQLSVGDTLGYGASFTASEDVTIGLVSAGYGDGLMRRLGDQTPARTKLFIHGKPAHLLGRVSMDSLAIDLTNFEKLPEIGDLVEIFGTNQSVDQLAIDGHTISYELLTQLGNRYKRIYT